jgi:1-aminocyclopropane-1-carboxylate deaminase/D-cysteine desulfhydrase-like pyridoxal-dependent ACC family enzyme
MTTTSEPARALARRLPAALAIPRLSLATLPSPVVALRGEGLPAGLWIKRDDLNAPEVGGNKVRALEFLLAPVPAGATILTVGGEGSLHILATAWYGKAAGLKVDAIRWPHEMTSVAHLAAERAAALCNRVTTRTSPLAGMLDATVRRMRGGMHWIPLGGSSPLGALGHVCAALELAEQVDRGECPPPGHVVTALGSGGTAAGLLLGLAIAGIPARVVAARVGPRTGVDHWRVMHLARQARRLLQQVTGEKLPPLDGSRLLVTHDVYAGAYGRPLPRAESLTAGLERDTGVILDPTYSGKSFVAAVDIAATVTSPTLYWLTFDARSLRHAGAGATNGTAHR